MKDENCLNFMFNTPLLFSDSVARISLCIQETLH